MGSSAPGNDRDGPAVDDLASEPVGRSDVTVVVTTFNHAHFLGAAIDSVLAQSTAAGEILVIDDGSDDEPSRVLAHYPTVRYIRQDNQGLSAARNTGLRIASCGKIVFLDADDRLLPRAIETGIDCFSRAPDAAFVFGGHREIDESGQPRSGERYSPIGSDAFSDFLKGNPIGMHATVLYDRGILISHGGFDTSLPRCEDYDMYLRLSRAHPVRSHAHIIAEYRRHGQNMSRNDSEMLSWALTVHGRQKPLLSREGRNHVDWRYGRRVWRAYYAGRMLREAKVAWQLDRSMPALLSALRAAARASPRVVASDAVRALSRRWIRLLPASFVYRVATALGRSVAPPVGSVDWGDLRRVKPVDGDFGFGRGTPVDRYYIEAFLAQYASDICGRALEVGDDAYCRLFGAGRVSQQDILHISPDASGATIIGDLSQTGLLPPSAFDCMVLTQTLHLIYDLQTAVSEIHHALKPGGVALVTVPGISSIDRGEWGASWYWSLTAQAARRLFERDFGMEHITVNAAGNVYAATAFLQGLALEEVDSEMLDSIDTSYPVVVTIRAQRRGTP